MSMKAVVVHEYGDSSQLKYEDVPIPDPGEGEVGWNRLYTVMHPLRWSFLRLAATYTWSLS